MIIMPINQDGDDADNDDYMFDNDNDEQDSLSTQAQFDNVDLPPGVEASASWLKDPALCVNAPPSTSTSALSVAVGQNAGARTSSFLKIYDPANSKIEVAATSTSMVLTESNADEKEQEVKEDEIQGKFQVFKRFDIVDYFSDHHFHRLGLWACRGQGSR